MTKATRTIEATPEAAQVPALLRTRPAPDCYLCQSPARPLYEDLTDNLFGAPGIWNLVQCPDPKCGLVWLNPMPVDDDLGQAYAKYYTHGEEATGHSWLTSVMRRRGQVLRSLLNPARHERDRLLLMDLSRIAPGKLLDVGCGDGTRIAQLRKLGWDVCGQDLDPAAVGYARETLGLRAFLGPLGDVPFPPKSFDCVTLNHVIEHVHDPVDLLEKSRRFLKPGGRLVVITPNVQSFAHQHFGRLWRGLEPPRHLHLFSPRTLSTVILGAGFSQTSSLRTSIANAQIFAHGSLAVKNSGQVSAGPFHMAAREVYSIGFLYNSYFQHRKNADSGEEIVLHALR
jgi:2-polyprenyl-3-methyl-5-hydroxy-6-metoxy-1,4-benzoquinol methylase